jgi:hypothetical protein
MPLMPYVDPVATFYLIMSKKGTTRSSNVGFLYLRLTYSNPIQKTTPKTGTTFNIEIREPCLLKTRDGYVACLAFSFCSSPLITTKYSMIKTTLEKLIPWSLKNNTMSAHVEAIDFLSLFLI